MKACRCPLITWTALCATLLGGCSTTPPLHVPNKLDLPPKTQSGAEQELDRGAERRQKLTQTATPRLNDLGPSSAGGAVRDILPAMGTTPVSVNVQNVPVPVFVNEVFGNLLDLNVSMTPQVSAMQELVTLRTEAKQKPEELYALTRQLLAEYGVTVSVEGNLVKLATGVPGATTTPPLIISGRASPQVPLSHRPVFQIIELDVVRSGDAVRWLSTLFGQQVKVLDESGRNSIIISGKPEQVQQAVDALRVFDRPLMRGRVSTRLEPAFMSADQLTDRLVDVMNVQGYGANRSVGSPSSIIVLPITAVNSVLIFANTQQILDYATSWARELDKPSQQAGTESMFYYQVKNTKAQELVDVLGGVNTGSQSAPAASPADGGATPASAPAASVRQQVAGTLLVDEPRNAIIYRGDPSQWERTLTLVRQMDKAPRQVMIEVTIAEVTLNDDNEYGLTWFAKNGFGRFDGSAWLGQGSGGASPGASSQGLTYLLDVAGQNRVALTAFANDNRVSILSTPRLLVKSGSEANFDVGTEVPTVTTSTTSPQQTDGTSNLLQSIQYRKTGVILQIKPTVYSDNRIDLDITQEVSEAQPLDSNATANSPSIFNRSITTSLSLRDGGSVVFGGLMSGRHTDSDSGIPFVKDIPVVGNLFKSKSRKKNKTELVIMIVPYIIENDEQATSVSQAIVDRLEHLEIEQFPRHDTPGPAAASRAAPAPFAQPLPGPPATTPVPAAPTTNSGTLP